MSQDKSRRDGCLTIFFGYAPGVGKTTAMLSAACVAMKNDLRVAIGCVNTHGEAALDALVATIAGDQPVPTELDLDSVIALKPDVLIVDVLAHDNALHCRHKKRYQDVEELLHAGIDVYTTLDVLELDSLSERAYAILGKKPDQSVPDVVFEWAHQVELVDMTPESLFERYQVMMCFETAETMGYSAFSIECLETLREIAVYHIADWLGQRSLQRLSSETTNKSIQEHILVCLSPASSNVRVIRTAARMAKAFGCPFTAIFVESQSMKQTLGSAWSRLQENSRLAERLGAHVVTLSGNNEEEQIAEYAKISGVSKIVLGHSYSKRGLFRRSNMAEQLVNMLPAIDIYMIPDKSDPPVRSGKLSAEKRSWQAEDVAKTVIILSIATISGFLFDRVGVSDANIVMIYILGVLLVSLMTTSRVYGILASLLSVLIYDYCFITPYYELEMKGDDYPTTILVMLTVSCVTSTLMARMKHQAHEAAQKAYHTEVLLETSQKLQQAQGKDGILKEISNQIHRLLGCTVLVYPSEDATLGKEPYVVSEKPLAQCAYCFKEEFAAALWVYQNRTPAGAGTDTFPSTNCMYLAICSHMTVFAVVAIDLQDRSSAIDTFQKNLLSALLSECALALEKEEATVCQKALALQAQQEQLRATLLRGVSHDLRTPLTSISGNAGILMDNIGQLDDAKKMELYTDIYDDAMWLINLVENLLSLTRFENGSMELRMEPELLEEVIQEALCHLNRKMNKYVIDVQITDDMLMARMDSRLIIQVLINIIDNAIKYTPEGSHIWISVSKKEEWVVVEIADEGSGIPSEYKDRLFDMFYTLGNDIGDSRRSLGMGLALCKSIIYAHEGKLWVTDRYPHGAVFGFSLLAEEVNLIG